MQLKTYDFVKPMLFSYTKKPRPSCGDLLILNMSKTQHNRDRNLYTHWASNLLLMFHLQVILKLKFTLMNP